MCRFSPTLLCQLLLGTLLLGPARAADTVLWYITELQPLHISDGPMAEQGMLDVMLSKVIMPGLPQFKHRVITASVSRSFRDMSDRTDVCHPSTQMTPERSKRYLFSAPTFRYLPVGLIVRSDSVGALAAYSNRKGQVVLAQYLKQPGNQLGVVSNRAYGEALDTLLQQPNVTSSSASTATTNLQRMLLGGRITATLGYSFETAWFELQNPQHEGKLSWLPLQEQPESMLGRVSCSRSEQGQLLIKQLDQLLEQAGTRERLQEIYEQWLDPASRDKIRKIRQGKSR
ncbi:TIGR02285 family protein [Chitinimonas sp.]|uniref:TIGR02285 family protein n=1 Tax=Chitinimonas sp. TaxID=1934313 RepID=UPI0035AF3AA1